MPGTTELTLALCFQSSISPVRTVCIHHVYEHGKQLEECGVVSGIAQFWAKVWSNG